MSKFINNTIFIPAAKTMGYVARKKVASYYRTGVKGGEILSLLCLYTARHGRPSTIPDGLKLRSVELVNCFTDRTSLSEGQWRWGYIILFLSWLENVRLGFALWYTVWLDRRWHTTQKYKLSVKSFGGLRSLTSIMSWRCFNSLSHTRTGKETNPFSLLPRDQCVTAFFTEVYAFL